MLHQQNEYDYTQWAQPWAYGTEIPIIPPDLAAMLGTGDQEHSHTQTPPAPEPRSRGRPRVYTARNESALEKRRAQVRNAQRAYQQRKDKAAQATNQRQSQIIEALTDLATEVERLLKVSSDVDVLNGNDEVSAHMRRLRDTYDDVINRPCIRPEKDKRSWNEPKRDFRHDSENSQSSQDSKKSLAQVRDPTKKDQSMVDTATLQTNVTPEIRSFGADFKDTKYDFDLSHTKGGPSSC